MMGVTENKKISHMSLLSGETRMAILISIYTARRMCLRQNTD